MERKNWKPFLTGLATGGSIGFVSGFFKSEHLLMRALLSAYSYTLKTLIANAYKEFTIAFTNG